MFVRLLTKRIVFCRSLSNTGADSRAGIGGVFPLGVSPHYRNKFFRFRGCHLRSARLQKGRFYGFRAWDRKAVFHD